MSEIMCTRCGSDHCKKNGHIHNGKQNHRCKDCGRQFVMDNEQKRIPDWIRGMILKALLERLSLRGICRTFSLGCCPISLKFMNTCQWMLFPKNNTIGLANRAG